MDKISLDKVGPGSVSECGIGCLTGPKNLGLPRKVEWLQRRFGEGLRFFLFRDDQGRPLGFLEYVPGEYAWRPVDARGWLFVHCLWVYPRGQKVGGLGTRRKRPHEVVFRSGPQNNQMQQTRHVEPRCCS
jgi:hypothetical protein